MDKPRNELDEEPAIFIAAEEVLVPDVRDLKAMADIEAGRYVSHEAVVRWLRSWGTDDELPSPECGD